MSERCSRTRAAPNSPHPFLVEACVLLQFFYQLSLTRIPHLHRRATKNPEPVWATGKGGLELRRELGAREAEVEQGGSSGREEKEAKGVTQMARAESTDNEQSHWKNVHAAQILLARQATPGVGKGAEGGAGAAATSAAAAAASAGGGGGRGAVRGAGAPGPRARLRSAGGPRPAAAPPPPRDTRSPCPEDDALPHGGGVGCVLCLQEGPQQFLVARATFWGGTGWQGSSLAADYQPPFSTIVEAAPGGRFPPALASPVLGSLPALTPPVLGSLRRWPSPAAPRGAAEASRVRCASLVPGQGGGGRSQGPGREEGCGQTGLAPRPPSSRGSGRPPGDGGVCCASRQVYMNAVWHGWAIPMFLFLAILRLSLNYLIARGWRIQWSIVPEVSEAVEPPKEDLTVSEKFQLVLDVAQKAQNLFGKMADILEKIKNLFMWVQPEITQKLYIALWAAFLASCFFPYRIVGLMMGLYAGIKFFLIDFIFKRCPRLRAKYDTPYIIWTSLPTDPQLKERSAATVSRRLQTTSSRSYVGAGAPAGMSRDDDTGRFHGTKKGNFHEIFNLTENERPLAVCENGWRCCLINRDRKMPTDYIRNGVLYVTENYLCFESSKSGSSKRNKVIKLVDITGIQKYKVLSVLPGSGMGIAVSTPSTQKPLVFGAMVHRDEAFETIFGQYMKITAAAAAAASSGDS
ncbi:GRAM domain-containing protein 4 [Gracilinanus agilis]|uniref:GRAM domain-containing protein 4 n=1 Tax=Gracilinanus agilis TaxID=191870 RepID=UPI001CFC6FD5|nr:GRAM domain-containing protein 4 [Gracilinanus agilis]